MNTLLSIGLAGLLLAPSTAIPAGTEKAVALPEGVKAVWDSSTASRETTPSRERICINGLWRWQPAETKAEHVPEQGWGYFKVPGSWPGITDYMQKDSQTIFTHPAWQSVRIGNIAAAWYEREITIPEGWSGRRIALSVEQLNSFGSVFVDGVKCGELHFPGGELDLTDRCRPGSTHVLSVLVVALPLKGVLLSYTDSNSAREVAGRVQRRGFCGDLFLISKPAVAIENVAVTTSVRQRQISLQVRLSNLPANKRYALRARITQDGRTLKELASGTFGTAELKDGLMTLSERWQPDALWDIHTPQSQYDVSVALQDATGQLLDSFFPVRFGFREFWIEGRDFFLNGKRIWLCAVPLDNAQVGAAWASYRGARESLERLKSIGINFVYTHNYGCEPGSHLGFGEILRAADDVGMLVALSQPHFSHYDWKAAEADRLNGYARHAAFYVVVAQNHPSVVAYAMSHNATGYNEDMNPDMIDGMQDPRDTWASNNARLALRAEAIVKQIDPDRIVYHHAGGNIGSMHTSNFYPNFAPIQELSDWFEHWATAGVKPMFTCEYGAPFTWDWTMYRGWYKGEREFGSAVVPWEFCIAEWNAQFLGSRAYQISPSEAVNLRWEANQFRAGKRWHCWDYPHQVGSTVFDEQYPIFARYLADNWPAFRTWGVSAISPWEFGHYWKTRSGLDRRRQDFSVDWNDLQRPGFSPDYIEQRYERMDLAWERSDWIPTAAAETLLRYNQPLLAYIAGEPARFTSKDHVFAPGETIEKQIVIINNSRENVACDCEWSFGNSATDSGSLRFTLPTGEQRRVPLRWRIPETINSRELVLKSHVRFNNNESQTDSFRLQIPPPSPSPQANIRIALFDPKGETREWIEKFGVRAKTVEALADLTSFDVLILGKSALTLTNAAPDLRRVRDGLKVIVFEQSPAVLEKRLGFRVAEYGLREVFARVPDHPVLAGIQPEHLRDWRGEATILPPRLTYTTRPRHGPTVQWCDIPVPRIWRCGNRGNVASVLIEKPARGDFMPIVDGGYALQYSPLLEYREGRGMVLFCQLDVTGRTEDDPVAKALTQNIFRYVSDWKPRLQRKAVYVGDGVGRRHLESCGISLDTFEPATLTPGQALILGPNGAGELARHKSVIADWLYAGGNLVAFGVNQEDADSVLPNRIRIESKEHIATFFEPLSMNSVFAGINPADLHNRDPRALPLISSGAEIVGDGSLARATNANISFCQMVPWQFDPAKQSNLKRTFRKTSFAVTRLLANVGVSGATPLLERFQSPLDPTKSEQRWLKGLYLDEPEEWDDPYRFFRW